MRVQHKKTQEIWEFVGYRVGWCDCQDCKVAVLANGATEIEIYEPSFLRSWVMLNEDR